VVLHDYALYKSTFTLLYLLKLQKWPHIVSAIVAEYYLATMADTICGHLFVMHLTHIVRDMLCD